MLKQANENLGLIHVLCGEATGAKIEAKLKHLINDKWDWRVKQPFDQEFLASFPSKDSLETFSKPKRIELAIHNIVA